MNKEAMYKKHVNLIHKITKRHMGIVRNMPTYSYEDMFQIATIGFLEACESFDESKGVVFKTYASKMMHWHITTTLRAKRNLVRYPCYFEKVWNEATRNNLTYTKEDMKKLAKICNYTYKQVEEAMRCYHNNSPSYLDSEVSEGTNLYDMVTGESFDETEITVSTFLESLTSKQKQVALLLLDGKSQTEIGNKMGISQQYVSRIVKSLQKAWLDTYE